MDTASRRAPPPSAAAISSVPLIAIAAAAYLAFRVALLHLGFDTVAIPSFEVSNIGSLAKLASECRTEIPLYLFYDNCGGHLVTGLLAAPLYGTLGESYLVLKFVPVLLGLGTLILIWRILERHGSRRAAVLGALLFVLGPPTLTKFSTLAQGNHFENLFFQIAAYALFLRAHDLGATPRRLFALGVAAGFSFFFYFGSAALLLGLAVSHLAIRGAPRTLRDLRFALPGFFLGVSPLVALLFAPNGQVQRFLGAKLDPTQSPGAGRDVGGKLADFFVDVLPRAGRFQDLGPVPGQAAEFLFLACFVLAWIAVAIALVRAGAARWRARQLDARQLDARQLDARQLDARQLDARQLDARQLDARELDARELDARELDARELDAAEISAGERAAESARPAVTIEIARLVPLLLHLPVVVFVFALTEFHFAGYGPPVEVGGYRYLVPYFAFATMLIPFGFERLLGAGGGSAGIARLLAAGSAATCLFTLPLLAGVGSETGIGPRYAGFVPRYLSLMVLHDWDRDPASGRRVWDHAVVARRLEGLSAWEHHGAMEGVGHMLAWEDVVPPRYRKGMALGSLPLHDLAGAYAEPYGIDVARGAGSLLRRLAVAMKAQAEIAPVLRDVLDSRHPLASYVAEGLCLEYSYPLVRQTGRDLAASLQLREIVPAEHRHAWARGLGVHCGRLVGRGVPSDIAAVVMAARDLDPAESDCFWTGVGWGLADLDEDPPTAPELARVLADHVPAEHRPAACEGFGRALRHLRGPRSADGVPESAPSGLPPAEAARLERGWSWASYPTPEAP